MSSTLELSAPEVENQDRVVFNEDDEFVLAALKVRNKAWNYRNCGVHVDAVLSEMAIADILGESPNAEMHRRAVEACLARYSLSEDRLAFIADMTACGRMVLKDGFGPKQLTGPLEAIHVADIELNRLALIGRARGEISQYEVDHFTNIRNEAVQRLMFVTRVVG